MYICVSIHIYVSMCIYTAVYIYTTISSLLALPGFSCKRLIGQHCSLPEAIQRVFLVVGFLWTEMVRSKARSSITTKNQGHLPEVTLWPSSLVQTLLDFFFFF